MRRKYCENFALQIANIVYIITLLLQQIAYCGITEFNIYYNKVLIVEQQSSICGTNSTASPTISSQYTF